jgi:hypothetical protein
MKKLLAISVLFAVLVPASAFALEFTNMSGVVKSATVSSRYVMGTTNDLSQTSKLAKFINGIDLGTMTTITPGVRFFNDQITFTGVGNDAQIIVTGDIVRKVTLRNKKDTDTYHRGPATFTLFSPAVKTAGVRLEVSGAVQVTKVRSGHKGVVTMSFQPGTAVFNTYTGTLTVPSQTIHADVSIFVPMMHKTFRDISTID